jgi:hypothetical protein
LLRKQLHAHHIPEARVNQSTLCKSPAAK